MMYPDLNLRLFCFDFDAFDWPRYTGQCIDPAEIVEVGLLADVELEDVVLDCNLEVGIKRTVDFSVWVRSAPALFF